MVTEPDTPTLDLQAAMRGMDVADEIRRQYGSIPEDPEEVDRDKVKAKLLERYEALGEAADPFAVSEAIDAYLSEPNRFRPPRDGWGLTVAHGYVRRRQIGKKASVFLLAAAVVAVLVVSGAEKRTRRAEADSERLVGELLVFHGLLEAQLEAFSETPQVLGMDADVRTAYYDHLDRVSDQLDAARPFFDRYAPEGDAGAGVTAENREDANQGAGEARSHLVSADGFLDEARGVLELSRLDAEADRLHGSLQAVAIEAAAAAQGRELYEEARRLADAGDVPELRQTVQRLADLGTRLDHEIRLVIVGGVWRYENRDPRNRNYYLRVQALDAYGNPVEMSIRNEETGQTERVREWGERVPKSAYDRVGADKADNGVIDDNLLGTKRRGYLAVERQLADVGQITRW